jgi:hypothetical protein
MPLVQMKKYSKLLVYRKNIFYTSGLGEKYSKPLAQRKKIFYTSGSNKKIF